MKLMSAKIQTIIQPMFGKKCCRVKVGEFKSLSMGFGEKIYHNNPRLNDTYYGEWEIGTYHCCWRVVKEGKILCGATDPVDYNDELEVPLNEIKFGSIISIDNPTTMDVRVTFDSGVIIDFLSTISYQDEYFHIICPEKENKYIEFLPGGEWREEVFRKK